MAVIHEGSQTSDGLRGTRQRDEIASTAAIARLVALKNEKNCETETQGPTATADQSRPRY
jgi:hypothetical protein